MIKNREFNFLWLWILIGYAFFPSNLTGVMSVQLLFFLMIGVLYAPRKIFKNEHSSLVVPILFLGLTFFSLIYDFSRVIERDLVELLKPILAFTYLSIGLRLGSIDRFNSTVLPLFVLSVFFGFLEISTPDFVRDFRSFYVRDDSLYAGKPINFWFTTYFAAFFISLLVLVAYYPWTPEAQRSHHCLFSYRSFLFCSPKVDLVSCRVLLCF
jgi:hypothetical protein